MKKDNWLVTFIKGFIIGLGIIFPISASGLAISLGVYEKLLNAINTLRKDVKKNLPFLIPIGLGIVISAAVSCILINYTYKKFPIATLLFFEGLIIGGFPLILKKTEKKYNLKNFIWFFIGITLLVGVSLISAGETVTLTYNATGYLKGALAGLIAGGTMIIPGVSGSLILVILGFYEPLLEIINNVIKFNNFGVNFLMAFCFGIGMLVGLFIISKVMNYFLNKHRIKTYFAVVGFVLASIINVAILICKNSFNTIEVIVGIVLLIIGFLLSFKFLKEE